MTKRIIHTLGAARLTADDLLESIAPLVAALLWMQHPRARFAAYIFFTVAAVRGLFRGAWPVTAFAIAAILLLQTPAAARAWPRLRGSPSRGR